MELITAYKVVHSILDDLAIDHWLDAGTLLWTVRNGHIKPDDKDIDLGGYYDQVVDSIKEIGDAATKHGFELMINDGKITFRKANTPVSLHLYKSIRNDVELLGYAKHCVFYDKYKKLADILNYGLLDGLTAFGLDFRRKTPKNALKAIVKYVLLRFPIELANPLYDMLVDFGVHFRIIKFYELIYPRMFFEFLQPIDFYDTKVCIPLQSDMYLKYCYGDDWEKRPDKFPRDGYYQIVSENSKKLVS